ncbi:valine--tRNA ligase [bacterium CG10_46_32]|nr:MAG: valine--tRNA ligase [bacterium CG10_46_32]PIR55864.1 MAG: valine--tRNA ligase [Parcubacteria group bacterium CG10_big_fil_rev_8_21_14_0_10_46_32]
MKSTDKLRKSQAKSKDVPKAYEPQKIEDALYKKWEYSGLFKPDLEAKGKPFSISMPPPNATGTLHLGHAVMLAIEDIMARHARMNGRPTLWVPGTDHASIATENKVEKILLEKKKKTKQQIGRETFLKEVKSFVEESQSTIKNQVRKIGASCDWSHERYTLDDGLSRAVSEMFIKMHNDGLIYRGHRIVNWCTRCQSTLADDEVEHKEQYAPLYTFTYDKNFPIPIATTRPETKLGDTAVAVHPNDTRYKKYVGQTLAANFLGTPLALKIIADTSIDPNFGTGALGVTPAHSLADAELARTHNLKTISVINEHGKINDGFANFSDQYTTDARAIIATELKKQGLITDQKDIAHNLSVCYRCDTPVEPLVSEQWFVSVDTPARIWKGKKRSLKEIAVDSVTSGDITIIPNRFNKTYFNWMDNLHDWCISRQIWFGHRIPVWYSKNDRTDFKVQIDSPGKNYEQDPDTLDTWFSSALWTFSTLLDEPKSDDTLDSWIARNKKKGTDLATFHPTSVMETGYDILFFWVARMILMTTYALGEAPFKTVYLHGLVRDKKGQKMSKSLGNGIDPLDMIKEYGADATRLSLVIATTAGNDTRLYEEKVAGYRNFVNKIWNISRFIIMHQDGTQKASAPTLADQWIQSRLQHLIHDVSDHYEKFEFGIAGEKIYNFIWHELADWYVEISKQQDHTIAPQILLDAIKLLHPFTPFVTEEIYQLLKKENLIDANDEFLAGSTWPKAQPKLRKPTIEADFSALQELITSLRDLRTHHNLPYAEKLDAAITTAQHKDLFQEQELIVEWLTKIRIQVLPSKPAGHEEYIRAHTHSFDIYLKIGTKYLQEQEVRMTQARENLEQYIKSMEAKLANKQFTQNAPKTVVDQEKQKLADAHAKLAKLG